MLLYPYCFLSLLQPNSFRDTKKASEKFLTDIIEYSFNNYPSFFTQLSSARVGKSQLSYSEAIQLFLKKSDVIELLVDIFRGN